jgi:RHS repeat-associated protein
MATFCDMAYTWDANKNKTSESITGVMSGYGFTAAGTTYDFEDRLTGFSRAATSGPALLSQSWSLTAVGDWTSVTTNGTAQSRTHGPTHELLTAGGQNVATDVKGNITTLPANLRPTGATTAMNLTWDSDNKLRSADIDANGTADVNFQYDALGRRVARSGTGGSVVYVQMDQQTIADYPVGGAATTPTFRYVYASYIDEPVVRKTAGTGGTLVYFHRNHQYSITAVTTSTGSIAERYAYTAYGLPTILNASATIIASSAISNRYTYTGREWDATLGLHHFRARWMSGLTGRFLTRDPIGFNGGKNLYRNGFDLRQTDPSGMRVTQPECQRKANGFLSENWREFSKHCGNWGKSGGYFDYDLRIACKVCGRNEPKNGTALGFTGCEEKNNKNIFITICVNRIADLDEVDRTLRHEYQHSKDICSCKQKCMITSQEPSEKDKDYCEDRACLELRAFSVDGGCDNPPPGKTKEQCIKDGAKRSLKDPCKAIAERVIDAVWEDCYTTDPRNRPPYSR